VDRRTHLTFSIIIAGKGDGPNSTTTDFVKIGDYIAVVI
jgi:hypothetical protein